METSRIYQEVGPEVIDLSDILPSEQFADAPTPTLPVGETTPLPDDSPYVDKERRVIVIPKRRREAKEKMD